MSRRDLICIIGPKLPLIDHRARSLAVKDNIVTFDLPTTCGSAMLQQHQSPFEAFVVAKLRAHGCQPIGKTNLDEFGMGSHSTNSHFGPVHHPLSKDHSAGGSSGGSAVAVANRQFKNRRRIALGTDTGGSVRLPAAYTGIVGFKPSYGLVSRWGVIPYANSLDTVGVLTASVNDSMEFFKHAAAHDHRDPTSLSDATRQRTQNDIDASPTIPDWKNMKIGIPVEYNIAELEAGVRQAWIDSLNILQTFGCTMVPVSLPNTKHALSAYYVIAASEAASNLSKYDGVRYGTRKSSADGAGEYLYSDTRGSGFGDEVKRRILLGSYTLSANAIDNYFIKAQRVRRLVQRDFDRVFRKPNPLLPVQQYDLSEMDPLVEMEDKLGPSQVDFIVCPTAPTVSPSLSSILKQAPVDTYMNDVLTVPSSLAGIPAISIPVTVRHNLSQPGEPAFAGIQVIGPYGNDHRLLHFAKILETCFDSYRMHTSPLKRHTHEMTVGNISEDPALIIRKLKCDLRLRQVRKFVTLKGGMSRGTITLDERVVARRLEEHRKHISDKGNKKPTTQKPPRLGKHKSAKGDSHRKPTTQKEVNQVFEQAMHRWETANK